MDVRNRVHSDGPKHRHHNVADHAVAVMAMACVRDVVDLVSLATFLAHVLDVVGHARLETT